MVNPDNWRIIETEFPRENLHHKETIFTIGNGYFSSRGSFEEGFPGEIATTFVHGVFNDVPTFATELVNFPDPFSLWIFLEDEAFCLDQGKILGYRRELDMSNGLLRRDVIWESPQGRQVTLCFERFMNMANVHHAALRFTIKDCNFNGRIQVQAGVQGVVSNEHYRHWEFINQGSLGEEGCFLELETSDTHIKTGIATMINPSKEHLISEQFWNSKWTPTMVYDYSIQPGDEIHCIKHAVIYTSRELLDPNQRACSEVAMLSIKRFSILLQDNQKIWQDLWSRSNVVIEGDNTADQALRYNLFQVLIAAPRHDDTVSIGAKTLSGYGYRGHVFWDVEIFLLPFLIYTQPDIAKNLLMYRYHTLPGARIKAKKNGYKGAMYAWESAATGEEVTPSWVVGTEGELIKIWCGEIEQHITADVAYGIQQYWHVTGDDGFMRDFGAEIVLSAAQFYASRLVWVEWDHAYHIRDVIGPDEYHEHVDDNAFTNLMAGWVLEFAVQVADWLHKEADNAYTRLLGSLGLTDTEVRSWLKIAEKIAINTRKDGVYEQFKGYFDLIYLDQTTLEPREISLQSQFGIERVQQYQFIKQPDVIMALYLLREKYDHQHIARNLDYYTPRTDLSQGSSLGPSIQALMLARYGSVDGAKDLYIKTLLTDLDNNRGNTSDGIHAASSGAVWQVMLMGFLGLEIDNDKPVVYPKLPGEWKRVQIKILWKDQLFKFEIF